jgi:hypothetical protein
MSLSEQDLKHVHVEEGNMIINRKEWEKFERELIRNEQVDVAKNISIFNALYEESVAFGVLPPKDPLDGIDIACKIARVVNHVPEAPGEDSE